MASRMEKEQATANTRHKIRVYAQYFVLNRYDVPKTTMEVDPTTGIIVPVTETHQELPGVQLAVNYNGLGISREEFLMQWRELGDSLFNSMKEKGITK